MKQTRLFRHSAALYIAIGLLNSQVTSFSQMSTEQAQALLSEQRVLLSQWAERSEETAVFGDLPRATKEQSHAASESTDARFPESDEVTKLPMSKLLAKIKSNDKQLQRVYGPDDEVNPKNPAACKTVNGENGSPKLALVNRLMPSVGILVAKSLLTVRGPGSYSVRTESHGASENLCPGECFGDHYRYEKKSVFGTCFLVSSNRILTASHVWKAASGADTVAIFGYSCDGSRAAVSVVASSNVVNVSRIVGGTENSDLADWIILELDRTAGNAPLIVRRSPRVRVDEPVFKIGHPFGLPAIVAGNAKVVRAPVQHLFNANLDAMAGDSGAPVFDNDGKVVGIFKGGGLDLERTLSGDCYSHFVAVNPFSLGQLVTSVSAVPDL